MLATFEFPEATIAVPFGPNASCRERTTSRQQPGAWSDANLQAELFNTACPGAIPENP